MQANGGCRSFPSDRILVNEPGRNQYSQKTTEVVRSSQTIIDFVIRQRVLMDVPRIAMRCEDDACARLPYSKGLRCKCASLCLDRPQTHQTAPAHGIHSIPASAIH